MLFIFSVLVLVPVALGGGHGYGHGYGHSVAIKSKGHSVHTYPVKSSYGYHKTPVVDINSHPMSIKLRFNSHSSKIKHSSKHYGGGGKVKKSYSVDHPDILIHTVKKPVVQKITEIITPYRKRVQIVKPVREKTQTIIATGKHGGGHYGGHGGGGGGHYGGHGGGHYGGGHKHY